MMATQFKIPAPVSKKRKTSGSSESSRSRNSSQAAILGPELNDLVTEDKRLNTIIREKESINDEELKLLINHAWWNKTKSDLLEEEPDKVRFFAKTINMFIKQRVDNNDSSRRSRKKNKVSWHILRVI